MYSLGIVTEAFLGIILTLDTWVYSLISSAYKIFMAIASARILQEDAYKAIAEKVYIIVGVGMLFVLAYAILKAIVDPDQTSKGDMAGGKIVKSIAIAVVGLIVTPMVFNLCYMAQGKVLEDDILGKLFFRTEESVDTIKDVNQNDTGIQFNYDQALHETGGAITATSVWQAFFYPAEGEDAAEIIADPEIAKLEAAGWTVGCAALGVATVVSAFYSFGLTLVVGGAATLSCFTAHQKGEAADKIAEAAGDDGEVSLQEAYMLASAGEGFAIFQAFVEPIDEGQIKYTWFISTVCGVFVAYAFATYAIDMGLRAAKLAYYQVVAPIPLILQVLPKKGDMFGKYVKAVFTTFLEVFIRISVVYIVVYIIAHLNSMFSTEGALWNSQNLTKVESMIAMALLIIGLVLFAKQAPKLISETFGLQGGADLGLNMMDRLRKGEVFTAGAAIGSAVRGGVQGAVAGARKDGKWYQKIGRGIGSAVAGAGSSAVRSGVSRFKTGKPVQGFKDMRESIEKTTSDVRDKRKQREEFYRKNPDAKSQFKAKWEDAKEGVINWAVGSTDTSYDDGYLSTMGKIQDLRDALRDKTAKDPNVQAAKLLLDRLNELVIGDYDDEKFAAEVKRRVDEIDAKKAAGHYSVDKQRFDRELSAIETRLQAERAAGRITQEQFDAMLKQEKENLVAAHLDSTRYNNDRAMARNSVDREEYRYTAEEKARLEGQLVADRKRAKDNYEATQDAAAMRLITENDPAANKVLSDFVTTNLPSLQKYANEKMDGDKQLGQVMAEMGIDLSSGSIDPTAFTSGGNKISVTYRTDVNDPTTEVTEIYTIGAGGEMKDSRGTVVRASDIAKLVEHNDGVVKNKTSSAAIVSDQAKAKANEKRMDAGYQEAQRRKRAEKK